MASVRFDAVCKHYGAVIAVDDLHLTCAEGEMLALLGPSGCGKSTTLKMTAGIETPSEGEIWFDDRMVAELPPGERNIAMVFEDYALYPHLTAYENIAFPLKVRGQEKAAIKARVNEAIELLGLEEIRDERVAKLSGGAQQRISIGRALVRDPDLILFDEPLSHLDADHKVQLRTQIKRLQQTQGVTSILVTHDQTEAIAMCDRIAVMNQGILQQVGEPQELYERPANLFVANFIGEPPMNQLPVILEEENGGPRLACEAFSLPLLGTLGERVAWLADQRHLVLGIRPEHVLAAAPGGSGLPAGQAIPGKVFAREPRGDSDTLLVTLPSRHGSPANATGGARIQAEVPAEQSFAPGESVALLFPEEKIILFDAESGENLALGA